jgi:LEA14-like dessication related protein
MTVRAVVFASKLRIALVTLLAVGSVVGGAYVTGIIGVPTVGGTTTELGSVSAETTNVTARLNTSNPNPFALPLYTVRADYDTTMNDVEMANGTIKHLRVPKGEGEMALTIPLDNSKMPAWWISHVENGEQTTVTANATVYSTLVDYKKSVSETSTVETNVLGAFERSERTVVPSGVPTLGPLLTVHSVNAEWAPVTNTTTPINVRADVENQQSGAYTLTDLRYEVQMNNQTVGTGGLDDPVAFGANERTTIDTRVDIDATVFDEWWVSHLRNDQTTTVTVDLYGTVDLPVVGEQTLMLDSLSTETTITTDLFE